MYRIYRELPVIGESELNVKNVFDALFHCTGKTLYVQNEKGRIAGIISPADFLKWYAGGDGGQYKYNASYRYIPYREREDEMLREAKAAFERYGIRGTLPIRMSDASVYGEIAEDCRPDTHCRADFYKQRFRGYRESLYRKRQLEAVEQLLLSQRILIWGDRDSFDEKLGFLFADCSALTFVDKEETLYEQMVRGGCLIVDVTEEYPLRRELYGRLGIGYMWDEFLAHLEQEIQRQMLDRCLFLKGLSRGHAFVRFLRQRYRYVVYEHEQNVETAYILEALELAGIRVIKRSGLKKEWGGNTLIGYALNRDPREIKVSLSYIVWFYLAESEYVRIKEGYHKNKILDYYMGKDIPFEGGEQRCFESADFFTKNRPEWSLAVSLPALRYEPEGDTLGWSDRGGDGFTYENGLRKTLYQPELYFGTVYCLGACTMWGAYAEDEDTIPAVIQKALAKKGLLYRVVNLGYPSDYYRSLDRFQVEEQDIIVIFHSCLSWRQSGVSGYIDLSDRMAALHTQVFFANMYDHVNREGSRAYAECMLPEILEAAAQEYALQKRAVQEPAALLRKNNPFDLYKPIPLEYERQRAIDRIWEAMDLASASWESAGKIGAVVMNADPFTRGHLYLVEQALLRVDRLYLFVVEEDKGFFSFQERFDMVQRGIEAYKDRVAVAPSGILISDLFFSAYFSVRKEENAARISTVTDQVLFARYYARHGNIAVRFVGSEESDATTVQYNRDMKYVLPYFGIEVVELKRAGNEQGREFRAGIVRKALAEGKLDEARWVIPESTYQYLKEKRSGGE